LLNQVTPNVQYFSQADVHDITTHPEQVFPYDKTIGRNIRYELIYISRCVRRVWFYNQPNGNLRLFNEELKIMKPHVTESPTTVITREATHNTTIDAIDAVTTINNRIQDGWSGQYLIKDVLLKYPFMDYSSRQPTAWSSTIQLEQLRPKPCEEFELQKQRRNEKSVRVLVKDYETLMPKIYLNDKMVDFILLSLVHHFERKWAFDFIFLCSLFYTKLTEEHGGVLQVQFYTRRIDIFEKRLILIPIGKDDHWTLCAVVNPGHVNSKKKGNNPCPCMIYFDSMGNQDESVHQQIIMWLNSQWELERKDSTKPFNTKTFPIYYPKSKICCIFALCFTYHVIFLTFFSFTKII